MLLDPGRRRYRRIRENEAINFEPSINKMNPMPFYQMGRVLFSDLIHRIRNEMYLYEDINMGFVLSLTRFPTMVAQPQIGGKGEDMKNCIRTGNGKRFDIANLKRLLSTVSGDQYTDFKFKAEYKTENGRFCRIKTSGKDLCRIRPVGSRIL